jgi:Bacterial Ig-like domain (group 3)/Chitobiase/beta-hexosaminidase C-terminal domain/FG-GAP-like repeat/Fn3 associated
VPDSGTLGPIVTADWNNDGYPSAAIADSIEGVDIFLGQRAAAQASVTNLSLSAGNSPTPSVVCAYSGDANYAASTSPTIIASFSTVTMPALSPAPGTYLTPTSVTLTGFTSSASTYYTTDGSNPSSSSTLYTSPFALSGAETVKAISYLPGWIPSPVASISYTLIAAAPVLSLPTGTYASGATVTITDLPTNGSILYSTDGTTPSIPYTGPITVTSSVTIEAIATAPNMLNSGIASASYAIAPATATPVITPSSRGYMTAPSITITPAVAGTPIYYTLGGRTPTAASTLYTGPFTISTTGEPTVTVKAVAIAPGDAISPVASASYTNAKTNSVMTVSGSDPYALSCTVAGPALLGVAGPSGTVTFADTTTSQTLGTASLGTATQGLAFDPTYKLTGTQANVVAVGDFNGDGIPDLLEWGPNGFGGQAYAVQLGDGLGGFGSQITLPPPDVSPNYVTEGFLSAVVGDFNGDGKLDVAYFVESEDGTDDSSIYVTLNVAFGNGDGTFQAAGQSFAIGSVFIPDGYSPIFGTLVAGDFNGDGLTDVAIVGTSVAIFPGSSSGLVQSGSVNLPSLTTPAPQVLVGAFAGSNLDIVATTTNGIQVTESNGDGGFRPLATQTLTFTPNSIAAADFNGDGKLDLAVTGQTGNTGGIWILLGNGDGTFQNPSAPTISGNIGANTSLVAGDFNGDGIPDLASAVSPGEAKAPITVALGNGNGTFQAPVAYPIGPYYSPQFPIVTADFNGDGRADLVSGQNVYISYTGTSAVASLTDVTVTAGSYSEHALQCTYPGDANYSGSSNATFVNFTQAATPTFSLLVGNYSTAQTVTIADASGGPIYYTSDGTNPTTSSTLYTGPISVSTTETLKAISSPTTHYTSAISEVVYTITDPPAFSVPGGTYSTQQSVSLTDGTTGAAIYYTTDGSTPGKTSPQYSTPITVVGNMTLNAVALAPGNLFSPVVSATYSVPPETTTTAIAASSLTAAENQKITLTASVTGMTPTGTVTFSAGTTTLGTATLTSGAASLQVSFPNAGSYVITAAYSGNATNAASTSSSVTVVVAQGGTTTALASSTLTANEKQMITLTATVTGDNPTGTVAFSSGSLSLGTGTLTSGVATLQTSFATAGSYIITASYSGDTNNLASTSSTITVVVAAPSFAVTSNPASQSISPGQSATFTFTVTPADGYTGTVDFVCGTLPSEATCSFNQSAVVITSGATGSSTLTISTAAPTTSRNEIPLGPWSASSTLALAGIVGLAFAPGKMRRWNRTIRALLCIALLGALWLPLMGCGGGGGGKTMVGGTPAGSYTVSVTASDSAGGATTTAQITLTVQ